MPESLEARSLSTYLRGSINQERQDSALALMGCVTLDKSTPFSEFSLCPEPEDWITGFSPALPARPCIGLSCLDTGHSRHIPTWTLDWERGGPPWE